MIVIITGASHTGKTRLAQILMEQYRYPYVCEDHIKMGLIRSGYTNLTPEDDDEMTEYLWPVIREMIKTAIENNQNLIVEGCYVPFDWQDDFSEEYLEKIKYICLCLSKEYIESHIEDILKNESCIEARLDDGYCTIEKLIRENSIYFEGCKKYNLEPVVIENDYVETIGKITL